MASQTPFSYAPPNPNLVRPPQTQQPQAFQQPQNNYATNPLNSVLPPPPSVVPPPAGNPQVPNSNSLYQRPPFSASTTIPQSNQQPPAPSYPPLPNQVQNTQQQQNLNQPQPPNQNLSNQYGRLPPPTHLPPTSHPQQFQQQQQQQTLHHQPHSPLIPNNTNSSTPHISHVPPHLPPTSIPNAYPQPTPPIQQQQQHLYSNNIHSQHQQAYSQPSPLTPQQQQLHSNNTTNNYNGYGQQGDSYGVNSLNQQMGGLSVTQQGFNKLWGTESIDLLQQKNLLPPRGVKPPEICFQHEYMNSINCSPELFRCTLTKIPETKNLLQKARLPLGILIHPFKDLTQLPVIQCSTIVRCRTCRTYINPYVYFVDQRRWKCNLCTRVNDLPEEFQYDPVTKTYGDPSRRPEVRSATIEFLAPADYMVRPPQAAVYLYLLDVSSAAVDTGYLKAFCDTLLENLSQIPGDARSQIGFITYDSTVHFYNLAESLSQPHQLVVCDIDDIFIPCPDNLLVSLQENKEIIKHLLTQLPSRFMKSSDNCSALGAALQAAHKLLAPIGGRITVFQCTLPTLGPGALTNREANIKNIKDLPSALNPSTDFYKKLALDCSSQYIAVDCFFINSNYVDIATISCVAKYSGGCVYHFPNYHITENPSQALLFEQTFQRYIIRKIGFEAVMRVRCSRGMSIHTFHGNLFVRSTDLLSLPNCNPDSGFGMQVSIDENLSDCQTVCFQAALLYTSSKGERRIRVHTLCLPIVGNVNDVLNGADQQCIIGLLSKMAVDRSLSSSLIDAREAFVNAVVDALSAYMTTQNSLPNLSLIAPPVLKMLPLYTHAILRSPGFRSDLKVRLDDRVHFMNQMKCLPLYQLIQAIYPDLYPIHNVAHTPLVLDCDDETPDFPLLHLCSSRIEASGVYLMDKPDQIIVYVCRNASSEFCQQVFNVPNFASLNSLNEFPELDNTFSVRIRNFVQSLQGMKPNAVPIRIFREDSRERLSFVHNLVEDRGDSASSYYEFLQQLKNMVH